MEMDLRLGRGRRVGTEYIDTSLGLFPENDVVAPIVRSYILTAGCTKKIDDLFILRILLTRCPSLCLKNQPTKVMQDQVFSVTGGEAGRQNQFMCNNLNALRNPYT